MQPEILAGDVSTGVGDRALFRWWGKNRRRHPKKKLLFEHTTLYRSIQTI